MSVENRKRSPEPVRPEPDNAALSRSMVALDQDGKQREVAVVCERAYTLYLNSQEIITVMTVGEHPRWLALGYLRNQSMLHDDDVITGVDVDDDLGVIVVRTERATDYEEKLQRRTRTSGCAMGTMFGDVMESFDAVRLDAEARIKISWLSQLTRTINTTPSLYLKAGAIHGCVLCHQAEPLIYVEDVGRHNAVDTIAGYMWENVVAPSDKIFYTTGRLTSEMILKTVRMEIPILVSRSGFTAWGVELARRAGLTLIGRARGERFLALSGHERIVFDDADNK
ncbi:MAG: formate dehydrogenase accessory sulfurtransferase FdhD [Hyphomicrobiales bacterium]|nr:formate dehydrogenase accessory sulfurtransferase FdhD [Hyphomicrobiales bacterium]